VPPGFELTIILLTAWRHFVKCREQVFSISNEENCHVESSDIVHFSANFSVQVDKFCTDCAVGAQTLWIIVESLVKKHYNKFVVLVVVHFSCSPCIACTVRGRQMSVVCSYRCAVVIV